jgi:hypothetical protein
VPYLNEVVDLGSFSDRSGSKCASVDTAIRADFDITADLHSTELRHFPQPHNLIRNVPKSIGADYGIVVHYAMITYRTPLAHYYTGVK